MRDLFGTITTAIVLVVLLSAIVWRGRGAKFEWTYDGVHHVLQFGADR